ncbi:protein NO VEIN domain-containing protein [Isoptericola sp. b408]|uniref:protein NO VEIN domain-containing protein n=1 Tax=Isoptericola sp. b408 TaxID=3064653 RepID=UPI0027127CF0|nr:DUF3883 domain-containing protein [Isoptericola sp. b408]MDO8150184.1 DUF3883 domain-containing protein [Isoptericola sp. b408]
MPAVILTWNPERSDLDSAEWSEEIAHTRAGGLVDGQWSVGNRRAIPEGQRAYLLRQGAEPRGVIASGWTTSEVFEDEHFSDPSRTARYVEVVWDTLVELEAPLRTTDLLAEVPEVSWNNIMGSGIDIPDSAVNLIEGLWSDHLDGSGYAASVPTSADSEGQGFEPGTAARRAVENHAQRLLEGYYRAAGWQVEDTRVGRPYDAVARRDGEVRYLEAKGTQGPGTKVMVTAGEVQFAVDHPGQCSIGVVTGIKLTGSGEVVAGSGQLEVFDWNPLEDELELVSLRWTPPRHDRSEQEASAGGES